MDTRSEPTKNPIEDQIKTVFDQGDTILNEPIEPLDA